MAYSAPPPPPPDRCPRPGPMAPQRGIGDPQESQSSHQWARGGGGALARTPAEGGAGGWRNGLPCRALCFVEERMLAPEHRFWPVKVLPPKSRPPLPEGKEKRERITVFVRSPCQENYPADAHTSAHKSGLESANTSGCTWSTAQAIAPSPGRPTPGVVKQDKSSGGSVDTAKTRSGPRRVRMSSGATPHSAQPQHTNYWAPRTRKRHQQEHRPQRPTERSAPTQHAKGRTGDCPEPRKETTTRRNVTQGGGGLRPPSLPQCRSRRRGGVALCVWGGREGSNDSGPGTDPLLCCCHRARPCH